MNTLAIVVPLLYQLPAFMGIATRSDPPSYAVKVYSRVVTWQCRAGILIMVCLLLEEHTQKGHARGCHVPRGVCK